MIPLRTFRSLHVVSFAGCLGIASVLACSGQGPASQSESNVTQAPAADTPDPSILLDVNDVSFLFGQGKDGEPVPNIPLASVVPKGVFDGVTKFGPSQSVDTNPDHGNNHTDLLPGADGMDNWRIVDMRVDPCGVLGAPDPQLEVVGGKTNKCANVEIRINAQPLVNGVFADTVSHFVFHPPAKDLQALVRKMVRRLQDIKRLGAPGSTDGVPLGEHPA
jgi:hypothetical protein